MAERLRGRKLRYPVKGTVNLVVREHPMNNPRALLPFLLAILLVVGLFSKLAVIDRLARVGAAQASLSAVAARLAEAEAANAGFSEISAQFGRYYCSGFTEEELSAVDRMEVLALLEGSLIPAARVSDASLRENTLTVNVSGLTLQELSDLMRRLKAQELVSGVSLYTAGTGSREREGNTLAKVTMTIVLAQAEEGGDAP